MIKVSSSLEAWLRTRSRRLKLLADLVYASRVMMLQLSPALTSSLQEEE